MNEYILIPVALTHDETIQVPVLDEDGLPTYDDNGNPITEEQIAQVSNYPYHFAGAFGDGLLVLHTEDPTLPGDTLVAQRLEGDQSATILDTDAYEALRPFGNNEDGTATGELLWPYIDGWPARIFPSGNPYPDDNIPFDAEARHLYFDTPATPDSTGWGFRVELIGDAGTRDPSARAIGVYSDAECTQYLWTTGAFQSGPSEWQVDEQGEPLTVWFTNSWDGDRPDERKDWHIAFLLGSAQEGHQTLPAAQDGIRYLFWDRNQGSEGGEPQPWESGRLYNTGERCTHVGETWESTMDGNHWEPGVVHSVWVTV